MSVIKLCHFLKTIELRALQIYSTYIRQGPPAAFAVDVVPSGNLIHIKHQPEADTKSLLDAIFGDGFLWAAVPKKRVTWERRNLRRHGLNKLRANVETKKNITTCLECGHHHLSHTICGNCYEKVKKETELMRQAMDDKDPDARMFHQPSTEVVYLYNDEADTREKFNGKYIVEMKRDRPTWWSKNLLTRTNRHR